MVNDSKSSFPLFIVRLLLSLSLCSIHCRDAHQVNGVQPKLFAISTSNRWLIVKRSSKRPIYPFWSNSNVRSYWNFTENSIPISIPPLAPISATSSVRQQPIPWTNLSNTNTMKRTTSSPLSSNCRAKDNTASICMPVIPTIKQKNAPCPTAANTSSIVRKTHSLHRLMTQRARLAAMGTKITRSIVPEAPINIEWSHPVLIPRCKRKNAVIHHVSAH